MNFFIFSPTYKKENTKYLVVHHTASGWDRPKESSQHLTAIDINELHRIRFDLQSSLGWWGGYNIYIDKKGDITQFRAIGEETCAQYGYNFDGIAISVCLAGNFTPGSPDMPTAAQIRTLQFIRKTLTEDGIVFDEKNIVPHRRFANTSCYGMSLSDDWARVASRPTTEVVTNHEADNNVVVLKQKLSLLQTIYQLYLKLIDLKRQVGLKGFSDMQYDREPDAKKYDE